MGHQKSAALNCSVECFALARFGSAVEKDLHNALLVAGEFPDVVDSGMGGTFPIDMAGAVAWFVGADAIEVAAETPHRHFHFAGCGPVQQVSGAGKRLQSGINDGFPL